MKTALESYLETVTSIEKEKILAEQEMQKLKDFNVESVLEPIQQGINLSIQKGDFNRTFTLIKSPLYTQYNKLMYVWYLAYKRDSWKYNRNANGYYDIPVIHNCPMLDFALLVEALEKGGYKCNVQETSISVATSKTGKYASSHDAIELNVDWSNCLMIVGNTK